MGFSRASEEAWRPFGPRLSLGFTLGMNLVADLPASQLGVFYPEGPPSSAESGRELRTIVHRIMGGRAILYGTMVELHLAPRWSLEVNALHRPVVQTFRHEAM